MAYDDELKFEADVVKALQEHGWDGCKGTNLPTILKYPTEKELLNNWAEIIFANNNTRDRLNGKRLSDGEMYQIMTKVSSASSPNAINGLVNGKEITICRDNPDDPEHLGCEITLKIFDRAEVASGQSTYQIAEQPKFDHYHPMLQDRRGDLLLLINGMPLFHIELKRSGIPVNQAINQIQKYYHEGVFSHGIMLLVQVFVAMNPEESKYFAKPGAEDKFNPDYYFNWGDYNNKPVNDWKEVVSQLLSIPMAHQMIGYFTVADKGDNVLKVMRSYQFYAARQISSQVRKKHWDELTQKGGYIWHTTGSGKTLTSFKCAQLIATCGDADKVVFLLDRIELGDQTLDNYRMFTDITLDIQHTDDTNQLAVKLSSDETSDTLIVTSTQKMSNITEDSNYKNYIDKINQKKVVFILDECHRSTFGDMLIQIKNTFPFALFFGFTGTPIFKENAKNELTTSDIFGGELHRYSISDGIRDKNVLGFDPYKILTYKDQEIKLAVALQKANAKTPTEALMDSEKKKIYLHWMNEVTMVDIEKQLPSTQYTCQKHKKAVVRDIIDNWIVRSLAGEFHAILATPSITDAIEYYRMFKNENHNINITALFDPSIDNSGSGAIDKEDALVEIITDYNDKYGKNYTLRTALSFKQDLSKRLAHKDPYLVLSSGNQLDLLIVVDQMLTGFDSKWINTLYLDKVLYYQNIIQAFSRTNRLFGADKPHGTICYYNSPHIMEQNIDAAIALYSGNQKLGIFVDKLVKNVRLMNEKYLAIKSLFESEGIKDFGQLPADDGIKKQFAKLFSEFNRALERAKVQGFSWSKEKQHYIQKDDAGSEIDNEDLALNEHIYNTLVQRYKELVGNGGGTGRMPEIPFDIDFHITEINTDKIDNDYMQTHFRRYVKALFNGSATEEERNELLQKLHCAFAGLSQEDQKFAEVFLTDLRSGKISLDEGKNFADYIASYKADHERTLLKKVAEIFGMDEQKLHEMRTLPLTKETINQYERYDALKATIDRTKEVEYWSIKTGSKCSKFAARAKTDPILRKYILTGFIKL